MKHLARRELDLAEYRRRSQTDPCFICRVVDRTHEFSHGEIWRDDLAVAFLNRYPTLRGALVAPLQRRCGVISDFDVEEYLALQHLVHRVGRAVSAVIPTERLYVLSLGSNQGNAHVHWHVAALPPGVPYEDQQLKALMIEAAGYIPLSEAEHAELAERIRAALPAR